MARFAPHRDTAQHFLEWLTGAEAQILYQKINYEFPIDPAAPVTPFLAPWSRNKFDDLDLNKIPTLAIEAQKIIDRTGWCSPRAIPRGGLIRRRRVAPAVRPTVAHAAA